MDSKTRVNLLQEVSQIKMAVTNAIPADVMISSIIIALAELQKQMALLLLEDEED